MFTDKNIVENNRKVLTTLVGTRKKKRKKRKKEKERKNYRGFH